MDKLEEIIQKFVNAGADLAEAVKHDVVHGGMIKDATILKLNTFIIAMNEIADFSLVDNKETDKTLN